MKLSKMFLMVALVSAMATLGCSDDSGSGGTAGSGGTGGTAGATGGGGETGGGGDTGGGGTGGTITCEETAQEVCTLCDAQDRVPECESRFDACRAEPPGIVNPCEACAALALEECGAL